MYTPKNFPRLLCALAIVCFAAASAGARDRDLARVISAKAGGVNHVAGDVTFKRAGATEWKRLTTSDDLKSGDAVRTGADGRAEILLNPGSYLRLGHNTEFVFAETKLDKLRLRLSSGSAVVEATGFSDIDVLVTVETPVALVEILRSGLYRFDASRAGATEVFVHSGRASVRGVLVKGGRFVHVTAGAGTPVATKFDKKLQRDALDLWSRERAKELARINDRLQRRSVNTLMAHARFDNLFYGTGRYGHLGVWLWSPFAGCYTFLPFAYGWPSPYGFSYGMGFYYYGANFCTPCVHQRLRDRNLVNLNPNLGWDTTGGGGTMPNFPKSTTIPDWKMSSPPASDGSRTTSTERGGAGGGKGDKP
ncbi:MAG TPA: FecR family protein [Pyrinomonadaceae bacterium]|nr:FecR family protein [Pyrinomonadaceae bacterium]